MSESVIPHASAIDDYPAAHSMDSDWFAVDADGNVAVFETGEAGICPMYAVISQDLDLIEELLDAGFDYNTDQLVASEPTWSKNKGPYGKSDWIHSVWIEAESEYVDLSGVTDAQVLPVPRSDRFLFYAPYVSKSGNLQKLFKSGAVLRVWTDKQMEYQGFGIFHYSCDEYSFGEPYELMDKPALPVKIDKLPPRIQERFAPVRFADLKFGEEEQVFPRRYFECIGWGPDE